MIVTVSPLPHSFTTAVPRVLSVVIGMTEDLARLLEEPFAARYNMHTVRLKVIAYHALDTVGWLATGASIDEEIGSICTRGGLDYRFQHGTARNWSVGIALVEFKGRTRSGVCENRRLRIIEHR